jgi:hypothetical protein
VHLAQKRVGGLAMSGVGGRKLLAQGGAVLVGGFQRAGLSLLLGQENASVFTDTTLELLVLGHCGFRNGGSHRC